MPWCSTFSNYNVPKCEQITSVQTRYCIPLYPACSMMKHTGYRRMMTLTHQGSTYPCHIMRGWYGVWTALVNIPGDYLFVSGSDKEMNICKKGSYTVFSTGIKLEPTDYLGSLHSRLQGSWPYRQLRDTSTTDLTFDLHIIVVCS